MYDYKNNNSNYSNFYVTKIIFLDNGSQVRLIKTYGHEVMRVTFVLIGLCIDTRYVSSIYGLCTMIEILRIIS